jgi:hypothetical protein
MVWRRHALAHDAVAQQPDAGGLAIVAAATGFKAILAQDVQRAAPPVQAQTMQGHAVVEQLHALRFAQVPRMRRRAFAQPQHVVPRADQHHERKQWQPDFQHVTILAHPDGRVRSHHARIGMGKTDRGYGAGRRYFTRSTRTL